MDALAGSVGSTLRSLGLTVATAESCTGGMVAARLTSTPGSSDYFLGGFVTYSDEAKTALLGVPPASLHLHGAVSAQTARAMAAGARERIGSDIAVSVTGIAGPGGGTIDKPVGLVFIGVATRHGVSTRRYLFRGTRWRIRRASTVAALEALLECVRLGRPAASD